MRYLLLSCALILTVAVGCGGDGGSRRSPGPGDTPAADTSSLSLTKSSSAAEGGLYRFTIALTNEGDSTATGVTVSDVWQEGLEAVELGTVEGGQVERIGDFGFHFTLPELAAGDTATMEYTVRCTASGSWSNTAATAASSGGASQATVSVECP